MLPGVTLCKDAYEACEGADALVIVTEWNQFRMLDLERVRGSLLRQPVMVDLRNVYEPEPMRDGRLRVQSSVGRDEAQRGRAPRRRARGRGGRALLACFRGKRGPKPLLRVAGGRSLLADARSRARARRGPGCVWLVCGREHAGAVRQRRGSPRARTLVEPRMRNTALAIGLAAARIAAADPDAVLVVLPADHRMPRCAARSRRAVRGAVRAAAREPVLVTLGVRPTRARDGLRLHPPRQPVGRAHPGLHRVRRFVEKPDAAPRASASCARGGHLWNAGIFVWTRARDPRGDRGPRACARIARSRPSARAPPAPARRRSRPRSRSPIAAPRRRPSTSPCSSAAARVWCLPVSFRWSDVGTWASLAEELGVATERSSVISGTACLRRRTGKPGLRPPTGRLRCSGSADSR